MDRSTCKTKTVESCVGDVSITDKLFPDRALSGNVTGKGSCRRAALYSTCTLVGGSTDRLCFALGYRTVDAGSNLGQVWQTTPLSVLL